MRRERRRRRRVGRCPRNEGTVHRRDAKNAESGFTTKARRHEAEGRRRQQRTWQWSCFRSLLFSGFSCFCFVSSCLRGSSSSDLSLRALRVPAVNLLCPPELRHSVEEEFPRGGEPPICAGGSVAPAGEGVAG